MIRFWPTVTTYQQFYASSSGQNIHKHIQKKIGILWKNSHQETIIGVGFPLPYLEEFTPHTLIFMPAAQGVIHWPEASHNRTCLSSECSLPLADNSVDKILLVHTLEFSQHPQAVMREMWRVLAPKGKLLVIVPNRLGSWVHLKDTPFSRGKAFNLFELTTLLQDALFLPLHRSSLIFTPPILSGLLGKSPLWDKVASCSLQPFGGLLIAEGEKQLYAVTGVKARKSWNPLKILLPVSG